MLPKISIVLLVIMMANMSSIKSISADEPIQHQLKPFVATYMITAMGLEGINVTNSLSIGKLENRHPDNKTPSSQKEQAYHFKSYSMPIGLLAFKKDETRDEQSEGLIIDGHIQPFHYNYQQVRNNKTHRHVELSFDWKQQEVTNHHIHKKSKWSMSVPQQTVDKLSYQLSLMLKLASNPEDNFSVHVADGGKLKEYYFELMGEERVYTSLGSYKALKIQHKRYKKEKNITLWCAPELNFLPVKIIQEEEGKPTFISTLISYQEGMSRN
ncbi:MAG: DUF3108 domain-containing protein [Gammaproteobacteria bacterium]|nr:DUF3108 domain-containing protein [Gammaproteobacteria bacterium]